MVATSHSPAKGGSEGKSTFQCQFPPIPPSTTIPLRERVEVAQEQQNIRRRLCYRSVLDAELEFVPRAAIDERRYD